MTSLLDAIKVSNAKNGIWWDELSEAHKNEIKLGIIEADNGDLIDSKEFWKNLKNSRKEIQIKA